MFEDVVLGIGGAAFFRKALVELDQAPFKKLKKNRKDWELNDDYQYPGGNCRPQLRFCFTRAGKADVGSVRAAIECALHFPGRGDIQAVSAAREVPEHRREGVRLDCVMELDATRQGRAQVRDLLADHMAVVGV